ncbi:SDR family oxidoreductase [Mycobacterium sp. B14F4]|uniref:SDR family oxidoreductase n=1 Tax=Mycobacterium sp. B14F4 TaxID=3153565 RepID=UPI00325F8ADB
MKITVIGATGLIGSKVVALLTDAGHTVVASSRRTGADVLTGDGLADALAGADVLVDVTNSPSFEDGPVLEFFTASTTNLVTAAADAGVGHYVALSIVGADGLPESGYMRAKVVQENIIRDSGLPYTIVRATQFHEFAEAITGSLSAGDEVHVPDALIQPIAADEVSAEVARAAVAPARNGHVDVGGPEKMTFADLARAVLRANVGDRPVVVTAGATYFGTAVDDTSLVTGDGAVTAEVRFADWLARRK